MSFGALLMMIFVHVGQISTADFPRKISMVQINATGYGQALNNATFDTFEGLYASNSTSLLGARAGLRRVYKFGLYSYCAYLNDTDGTCSSHNAAYSFKPYDIMASDLPENYTSLTNSAIPDIDFRDSDFLSNQARSAYYLLLIGTICAAVALFTGIAKYTVTFFVSTGTALLGSILLLAGSAVWTVIINRAESINDVVLGDGRNIPLGITLKAGSGLYLSWASFALLFVSVLPYMLSCCTYRG